MRRTSHHVHNDQRVHPHDLLAGHPVVLVPLSMLSTRPPMLAQEQNYIDSMRDAYTRGDELPPIVGTLEDGCVIQRDGNHRYHALHAAGCTHVAMILFRSVTDLFQALDIAQETASQRVAREARSNAAAERLARIRAGKTRTTPSVVQQLEHMAQPPPRAITQEEFDAEVAQ